MWDLSSLFDTGECPAQDRIVSLSSPFPFDRTMSAIISLKDSHSHIPLLSYLQCRGRWLSFSGCISAQIWEWLRSYELLANEILKRNSLEVGK